MVIAYTATLDGELWRLEVVGRPHNITRVRSLERADDMVETTD